MDILSWIATSCNNCPLRSTILEALDACFVMFCHLPFYATLSNRIQTISQFFQTHQLGDIGSPLGGLGDRMSSASQVGQPWDVVTALQGRSSTCSRSRCTFARSQLAVSWKHWTRRRAEWDRRVEVSSCLAEPEFKNMIALNQC